MTPNIEAAREKFAERVALAYERTWHGYGFTKPQYSYERALELGRRMAADAFPDIDAPVTDGVSGD